MIEILTLKLIIDFFDHLKTYKMEANEIQIGLWKKHTDKYQYFSFDSYQELWDFYYDRYFPFDLCESFGDIWFINRFSVNTNLDTSYSMSITGYDVSSKNSWVNVASQFDNNRDNVWMQTKTRQEQLVKSIIDTYYVYYKELYDIYMHGIYSVCYAEPGWTTHTTSLKSYKDILIPKNNTNNQKYKEFQIDY